MFSVYSVAWCRLCSNLTLFYSLDCHAHIINHVNPPLAELLLIVYATKANLNLRRRMRESRRKEEEKEEEEDYTQAEAREPESDL